MKRFALIAVCALVALALVGLPACGSSGKTSNDKPTSTSTSTSNGGSGGSNTSSGSGGSSSGFDFVDDCIDEHGNITLYALTDLKGWQLQTLLDQQGYEWNGKTCAWVRPEDGASFFAYKETGVFTESDYAAANEAGGAIVAVGSNIVAGYKDAEAAYRSNVKCVTVDSYFANGEGLVIFYGPSMKEYLAFVTPYTESTMQILIFSQEAVGSGMLDEISGQQYGGSFKEVWKTVTGRDSYGH